ncbi:MAG: patatin-like phospholipase family protein [Halioglobus sp.]
MHRIAKVGTRMARSAALSALLCLLLPAHQVYAAASCEHPVSDRPKIGLVLGGGGARGSAHIGVIRLLEELNIPVDYVTGTSIGSLVGALYATGMNADELENVILDIDWDDLFVDETDRKEQPYRRKRDDDLILFGPKLGVGEGSSLVQQGAISGQKINFLFESLIKQRTQSSDFSRLPIPYRAIATDLVTGEEVVLEEGDLALAMRASMSVPGLFDPVEWGDYMLVDGGLVNNVPIDVVRDMGADIVIAVNVGTGLTAKEDLNTMLSVVGQLTNFMTKTNTDLNIATLNSGDILIEPPLADIVTSADFSKAKEGIDIGYLAASTVEIQDKLRPLAADGPDYLAYRNAVQRCISTPPTLQFVRLNNHSRFADSVIMERVTVQVGDDLDLTAMESSVSDIYALGFLQLVRYELVQEDGETGLVFHVDQDSRGTQFIETGLDYSGGDSTSAINLRLGYLNTAIDNYGSELRVLGQIGEDPLLLVEAYKYFNPEMKLFMQPQLFAERREVLSYDDSGDALLSTQVTQYGGSLALGRELSRYGAISGGLRLFSGDGEVDVGPPETAVSNFDGGEYFLRGNYDRLDDRYFPGSGSVLKLSYYQSDEQLGADQEYKQIQLDALTAKTFNRHTIMGGLRYNETLDDVAPEYAMFRAGGFTRLSGFQRDEIAGQNFGMLLASYRYHIAGSGLMPGYIGTTLEYGQVADDASHIFDDALVHGSIYFAYRSPIGPLYLGIGAGEEGSENFFLRIGNVFGSSSIGR